MSVTLQQKERVKLLLIWANKHEDPKTCPIAKIPIENLRHILREARLSLFFLSEPKSDLLLNTNKVISIESIEHPPYCALGYLAFQIERSSFFSLKFSINFCSTEDYYCSFGTTDSLTVQQEVMALGNFHGVLGGFSTTIGVTTYNEGKYSLLMNNSFEQVSKVVVRKNDIVQMKIENGNFNVYVNEKPEPIFENVSIEMFPVYAGLSIKDPKHTITLLDYSFRK